MLEDVSYVLRANYHKKANELKPKSAFLADKDEQ